MLKVGVEILFLWTIKSMYCSTLHYWLKSWISRGAGGEKKLFVGFWVKNVSFYLILTVYHTLYWATIFTKNIQCSFAFVHKVLQSFCIFFLYIFLSKKTVGIILERGTLNEQKTNRKIVSIFFLSLIRISFNLSFYFFV
jgi:hypothetical protein